MTIFSSTTCENERVTDEILHRLNVYKITLGQFQSKLKAFMDKFYGEIDSVVDMEISKYPDMTKIYNFSSTTNKIYE